MLCNYFYHKMSISKVPLKPRPLFVVRNTVQSEEGLTDQDLKNQIIFSQIIEKLKLHNSWNEPGLQSQHP